jgi:cytidylate kinase
MIITISGSLGSGKSTIAKEIAKNLSIEHYSTGDFMRAMAQERSITLLELNKIAQNDATVDEELDDRQRRLGKTKDNFIIDGRLSWHFIPQSIKIFLTVSDEEAARRIFAARRPDEKDNTTLDRTLENIRKRRAYEVNRWKDRYSIDYYDLKNYDIIVDTTHRTVGEVVEAVMTEVKKKAQNK